MIENTAGSVSWTDEELIESINEFEKVYTNRPILDNFGGMTSTHMFYTWFVTRKLRPKCIVESGVWHGLGTWLFKLAAPDAKIFSIDINLDNLRLSYPDVCYMNWDFTSFDWNKLIDPLLHEDTLLFFDDHQNALRRISHVVDKGYGFRKMMFEDNYPVGQGDCISMKQTYANDSLNPVLARIKDYHEFAPIFMQAKTRWGTDWTNHGTKEPILRSADTDWYRTLHDESGNYTWICYVELHKNNS